MDGLNILIIDTSSPSLKLALKINDKEHTVQLDQHLKHIENLLPQIDMAFQEISKSPDELKYIAVCRGPGSFTGIRIGISTALGLAYGPEITCFGYSPFEVYEYLLSGEKEALIVPVIDAKKNRFYTSFISKHKDQGIEDLTKEEILSALQKEGQDKKVIFCGKDYALIKEFMDENITSQWKYKEDYSPRDLLSYHLQLIKSGNSLDYPHPIYVRKSEAEIAYLKKLK